MANNIKIASSLEAIINDTKVVSGKTYTIKEVKLFYCTND